MLGSSSSSSESAIGYRWRRFVISSSFLGRVASCSRRSNGLHPVTDAATFQIWEGQTARCSRGRRSVPDQPTSCLAIVASHRPSTPPYLNCYIPYSSSWPYVAPSALWTSTSRMIGSGGGWQTSWLGGVTGLSWSSPHPQPCYWPYQYS